MLHLLFCQSYMLIRQHSVDTLHKLASVRTSTAGTQSSSAGNMKENAAWFTPRVQFTTASDAQARVGTSCVTGPAGPTIHTDDNDCDSSHL